MNEIENNDSAVETVAQVLALPVSLVHRSPYQVRRETAADPDLVSSIAAHGLVHPITVREDGKGGYELIAGHRRFAAYREALPGEPIPATVIRADDEEAENLLVSENFLRLDLSVVEKAMTIKQLRDHGRSVPQIAELVRMSERTVFRFIAVGSLSEPWRAFLHARGAAYDDALKIARLPESLQQAAFEALLGAIADKLTFTVRKGNARDEEARTKFLAELDARVGDAAAFLDYILRASPDGMFKDAPAAARMIDDWFSGESGLRRFLGDKRVLGPSCPFDISACAGCHKRSDVQADLFDGPDGAREIPRCLDGDCWTARVAAAKEQAAAAAQSPTSDAASPAPGTANPGTDATMGVPRSAPASAISSDAFPESGKKEGISLPSPAPEPRTAPKKTSVGPDAGGNDRSPARAEASPSDADLGVRMGVVWTVAQLLLGDRLEEILPKMAALRADEVRRGGWRKAVREKALPRLARNRDAATAALATVEGMW